MDKNPGFPYPLVARLYPPPRPVAPEPPSAPAALRDGWALGAPPDASGEWSPMVCDTGDGWWAHWYRDRDGECVDMVGFWPWVEDRVRASDWERIGFEVA